MRGWRSKGARGYAKKATTPVRKTETKQEKTQELKDALSEELTTLSRDAVRAAFR
jgi:hypothetical protein